MPDVLIVGAGPAGSIAGLVLARAGVSVRLVDRATFPRDKLCGDTVNPGALARLRTLGAGDEVERRGLPVGGMIVTSARVAIEGRYPDGVCGRAIVRRDLDWILLQQAIAAGCRFEPNVRVDAAVVEQGRVVGVRLTGRGDRRIAARVTIAADGRRSPIAFGLGLARHPFRPRRWALGAYFAGVLDSPSHQFPNSPMLGEMHVRPDRYIGVARVTSTLTNVCLVRPSRGADPDFRDTVRLLQQTIRSDPRLADRFASAEMVTSPVLLGPLAVEAAGTAPEGLLLAGDAAGFVDPMTGDGLRFAIRGAELAAAAALDALRHGWGGVHEHLAARREAEFGAKQRFNRAIRALVGSPRLVAAAAVGATLAPSVLRRVIAHAGDCGPARLKSRAPADEHDDPRSARL